MEFNSLISTGSDLTPAEPAEQIEEPVREETEQPTEQPAQSNPEQPEEAEQPEKSEDETDFSFTAFVRQTGPLAVNEARPEPEPKPKKRRPTRAERYEALQFRRGVVLYEALEKHMTHARTVRMASADAIQAHASKADVKKLFADESGMFSSYRAQEGWKYLCKIGSGKSRGPGTKVMIRHPKVVQPKLYASIFGEDSLDGLDDLSGLDERERPMANRQRPKLQSIIDYLRYHPGQVFTANELGEALQIEPKWVRDAIGNVVRGNTRKEWIGRVRRVEAGKFTWIGPSTDVPEPSDDKSDDSYDNDPIDDVPTDRLANAIALAMWTRYENAISEVGRLSEALSIRDDEIARLRRLVGEQPTPGVRDVARRFLADS